MTLYGFVLVVAFTLVVVDLGWAGLVYALGGGWPDSGALPLGLLLMLALAFINTAGLLKLAFDFSSYGEQIEAQESSRDG